MPALPGSRRCFTLILNCIHFRIKQLLVVDLRQGHEFGKKKQNKKNNRDGTLTESCFLIHFCIVNWYPRELWRHVCFRSEAPPTSYSPCNYLSPQRIYERYWDFWHHKLVTRERKKTKNRSKLHVHPPSPEKRHHRDPLGKSETTCQIRETADN